MKPKDRGETFAFHRVRFMYTTNRTWRRIATAALIALFLMIALVIAILLWYFVFRVPDPSAQRDSPSSGATGEPSATGEPDNAYNGCFPPDSTVVTPDGRRRLDRLRLGDRVLDLRPDGRCCLWTSVYAFSFVDNRTRALTEIVTSRGQTIRLTPNHLIFRLGRGTGDAEDVEAGTLEAGHPLLTASGVARATRVRSVLGRGARSPLTYSGSVLVDDVRVSCFAGRWLRGAVGHRFVHEYAMAPLRVLAAALGFMDDEELSEYFLTPKLHHLWYVRLLKSLHSLF